MVRRRETETDINVVISGKRPQLRVLQIDALTCDSVQRNSTLAVNTGCDIFFLNQNFPKLSPWVLEESLSIFTLVSLFPTQSIAFPVVQDSFIKNY